MEGALLFSNFGAGGALKFYETGELSMLGKV